MDPDLVYVTTQLAGTEGRASSPSIRGSSAAPATRPCRPRGKGYATGYLWEETWARDSVLDLVRQFIHEVEEEDGEGAQKRQTLPHLSALPAARLRAPARDRRARAGTGQRYLIQHSAGSGKSFTIAWLAHQLATLHDDADDRRVFDSICGHYRPARARPPAPDHHAPVRADAGRGGEHRHHLAPTQRGARVGQDDHRHHAPEVPRDREGDRRAAGQALCPDRGRGALLAVGREHEEPEGRARVRGRWKRRRRRRPARRRPRRNWRARSWPRWRSAGGCPTSRPFAFTATPKPKTLELFGSKRADGKFEPFHLYSMRQAIEEGFILDVLANYTTYKAYWRLLKKVEDDPRYDKKKAEYLLKSFVELHPHAIGEKARICVEHFAAQVQGEIGGKAKAMIVTRSRLHAVRYKLAVDKYLAERGYPFKALVAFSGTVQDGGRSYTEAGMNGFPEAQTAKTFERPEYRFLIVANKFQTGFDQPLLHTMYVDKKLGGVNAVQTLSRLNRTHPEKKGTMVLDFANEADEIKAAFEPYYETTLLSEATDPNLLYEIQTRLGAFPVYTAADVDAFAKVYFDPKATQDRLYAVLAPVVERFRALSEEEQQDFRGQLTDYVRLYAFLAQVLTFADADLEKLYVFARHLRRLLPADRAELPREVQQNIDMESYRIQQTGQRQDRPRAQARRARPVGTKRGARDRAGGAGGALRIIAELNERFGLNLGPEHRVTLGQMMEKLDDDAALDAAARVNTRENVRLTFDQKVEHVIPGDRRLELRPLQAHHRRPALRRSDQELPLRPVPARASQRRGADQARGVEDAGVQVHAALEPQGGPAGRQGRDPRGAQDHRRVPQHRGRRPSDRCCRQWLHRRDRAGRARD